ncbi:MAG: glycosyltransferase, partial [Miltoncostaeaceae bacterium]
MSASWPDRPVWVVLPTYNEAQNVLPMIEALLARFTRHGWDGHVLVVDDGSPDGTAGLARQVAAVDPRVHVLERDRKEGIGPAYRAGFRQALDGDAGLIVEMDCDFSHHPDALAGLVAAASDADLVLGSRYVPGGGVERWGMARRAISRGGCWYARRILGVHGRDRTGGFKCFRREVLEAM